MTGVPRVLEPVAADRTRRHDALWVLVDPDGDVPATPVPAGARVVVGRGSSVDVSVDDPSVSRRHFEIEHEGGTLQLRDLGSSGGTWVDGAPIRGGTLLQGNVIEAGSRRFVLLRRQPHSQVPTDPGTLSLVHRVGGVVSSYRPLDHPLLVGRAPSCDVVLTDPSVSRRHARIRPNGAGAVLEDLGSANGVVVNGRRCHGERSVQPGDRIEIGLEGQTFEVEATTARPEPVAIEICRDRRSRSWAVEVDAGIDATVGDVAAALAGYLADATTTAWTLCRPDDGVLLHEGNRWIDAGVARGDHLLLVRTVGLPAGPEGPAASATPRVAISQLPRAGLPPAPHRMRLPRPPDPQSLRGRGVTWQIVGGIGIVVAGLLIAIIRPSFALFALIGGLVGLVSISAGIMGEQSRRKHAIRRFRAQLAERDAELAAVRSQQAAALQEVSPDPATLTGWAQHRDRRLWERRQGDEDFLRLRIGTGRQRTLLDVDDPALHSESPLVAEVTALLTAHEELEDVPILTPAPDAAPVVGLVGPRGDVLDVASWLVVQAALLHAPADLEIAVLAVNQDWRWTRWLPHVEHGEEVDVTADEREAALLTRRLKARRPADSLPGGQGDHRPALFVVVPHGASDVITDLVAAPPSSRTQFLVLADTVSDLPSRVDAVVEINGTMGRLGGPFQGIPLGDFRVDRPDHDTLARTARQLGRYVDNRRPPSSASAQVGLLDLLGVGAAHEVDVARLWHSRTTEPLSAVVGTTLEQEPLTLGFRSDGVHGVVGGTTGSGKSEFLQTLLVSLALTHAPDQLSLFLIDFKGGATFTALAALPHVVGVVTDLEQDASLAGRAFTSLEAEMARRKRLLNDAGVPNLVDYERLPQAANAPIPALLVVIDEFALLMQQQPSARERLDLVATQGRSLGVHLLLATQSPSNVISPAVRSNTQVWVSLRVVDDSESVELLGHRDAARIPADRPGRAYVRFGGAQTITGFQTARIARPVGEAAGGSAVSVRAFADDEPVGHVERPAASPAPGRTVTELETVCQHIASEGARLGVHRPRPLWLEPLPAQLAAPTTADGLVRQPGRLTALLGLMDDPAHQVQLPWTVDLGHDGNLLVVGTRGSGKSGALLQLAIDLMDHHDPADLHLYAIDSGTGSLKLIEQLPHCGGVVAAADHERLYRLFTRLTSSMQRRREELAASGHGDFTAWRQQQAAPEPWVGLLIDDYAAFKENADSSGLGVLNDQLLSLAQGGPAVGIHLVVSAAQAGDLRLNLVNLFGARVLLRQVDAADYSLLDLRLRPEEVPPFVPGRALVAGGHELQVYLSDAARVDAIAARESSPGGPTAVDRLPRELRFADLAPQATAAAVIGIGGDDHEPVILDLDRGERHLVIAGEGRTGRSTTLLTVYEALVGANHRFVALTPRPSPVRALEGRPGVLRVASTGDEISAAVRELPAPEDDATTVLLIDDAESLPPDVGDHLERLLRDAAALGIRSFTAGRSTDIARSYDGWLRYVLSLRSGLLLMPGPDAGFVLDLRLPPTQVPMCPGRGWLCEGGTTTLLQVALPS